MSAILKHLSEHGMQPENLNAVIAEYGENRQISGRFDPRDLDWPTRSIPAFLVAPQHDLPPALSLAETFKRDAAVAWEKPSFVKGCAIAAELDGTEIRFVVQPMKGDGAPYRGQYEALPAVDPDVPTPLSADLLINCMSASFLRIETLRISCVVAACACDVRRIHRLAPTTLRGTRRPQRHELFCSLPGCRAVESGDTMRRGRLLDGR